MRNIKTAISFIFDGKVSLDYQLSSGMNLQRGIEWSDGLSKQFIVALMNDVPMPTIHVVLLDEKDIDVFRYFVIDGKQRMTAILKFFNNEIQIPCKSQDDKIYDLYFKDLPDELKNKFLYHNYVTKGMLYEFNIYNVETENKEYEMLKLFKTLNWHETVDSAKSHLSKLGI